jgi:hypothetical protein
VGEHKCDDPIPPSQIFVICFLDLAGGLFLFSASFSSADGSNILSVNLMQLHVKIVHEALLYSLPSKSAARRWHVALSAGLAAAPANNANTPII